jgi:hypothetical protein
MATLCVVVDDETSCHIYCTCEGAPCEFCSWSLKAALSLLRCSTSLRSFETISTREFVISTRTASGCTLRELLSLTGDTMHCILEDSTAFYLLLVKKKEGIPVTGRGGP